MSISSPGIGSSLDVKSIVSQLLAAEQGPTKALDKKEASFNAKLSAIGSLKSAMSTLQETAQTLGLSTTFSTVTASVADTSAFSASASGTSAATAYNVEVKSLAQSQKLTSAGYASTSTVVGMGTLTLDTGTYSDAGLPSITFSAIATVAQKTITIDSSNNTLAGIRDAINSANTSVSATIINDGSNYRLSLTSKNSGLANAVKISVTEDGAAGLGQLAYNGATGGTSVLTQNAAAQNAVVKIDGITITKSSNTITDAIQGVTLNLTRAMTADTTTKLTLTQSATGATNAIDAFVKAYNAVNKQIVDATSYNSATGKGSILIGDATFRSIQSQLRSTLSSAIPGAASGLSVLSDAGISFQKDGTLAVNSSKLATALDDPLKDLSRLFVTSADGTAGFGSRVNALVSTLIFGSSATLNTRTDGINRSIKDISKARLSESARLVTVEKRYNRQFSALDTSIASMTSTSTFLTQQLAAMTASTR